MAAGSQAIDVGDAVLHFLGDTTQLDAAFDRVATQAETTMAAAAASVDTLGQSMVASGQAGTSLADAFKLIPPPIRQSDTPLQNMAFSLRGIPPVVEAINPPLERVKVNLREAKGEAALL